MAEGNKKSSKVLETQIMSIKDKFGGSGTGQVAVGQSGKPDAIQNYPAEYLAPDKHMNELDTLAEMENAGLYGGENGLFAKRQMTDKDVKTMTNRLSQIKQIEFEEWLHSNYDFNDPADVRFIREIYPEFFEKKIKFMEQTAELQKSLARMELNGGPKNFEDLVLKWAINTNQINLNRLNNPVHMPPNITRDGKRDLIELGAWNPRKFITVDETQGQRVMRTALHQNIGEADDNRGVNFTDRDGAATIFASRTRANTPDFSGITSIAHARNSRLAAR